MSHLSIANRTRLSHTQSSLSESADTGRLGNRLLRWLREGHALLSRFIRHLYNYYVSPQREAAPEHRRAACELMSSEKRAPLFRGAFSMSFLSRNILPLILYGVQTIIRTPVM